MQSECLIFAYETNGTCSAFFWAYLGRLVEPNPKLFLHSYERGCGWVGWEGKKIANHDKAQIKTQQTEYI